MQHKGREHPMVEQTTEQTTEQEENTNKQDTTQVEDTTSTEQNTQQQETNAADDSKVNAETKDNEKATGEDEWATTGDPIADSVIGMLKDSGITTKTAEGLLAPAVEAADISKVDKAALEEAVGKDKATLILAGTENYINKITSQRNEVINNLHEAVGGKDNWNVVSEWAKQNLPEEERLSYIDMIQRGGRSASLAAKDLQGRYESEKGSLKKDSVVPNRATQTHGDNVTPLSRIDYYKQLAKLSQAGKLTRQVEQQLFKARMAGKKQGI